MRGAIREDDVPWWALGANPQDDDYGNIIRVFSHFYDPINNQPLNIKGVKPGVVLAQPNETAPKWAMGASDVFTSPNTADGNRRNHFTVFDAREAMYRALTGRNSQGNVVASTEADRNKYWATTFRALGDTVHLLQDMGQPQHTRNEPHCGVSYNVSIPYCGHKSVYETYIDSRALNEEFRLPNGTSVPSTGLQYTGYPVPSFTNYLTYFTTRNKDAGIYDRKGLADYSNRGFFTAGKNMGNTDYAYPLNTPNTYLLEKVYTDWQGNPLPNGSYVTLLKDIVPDTLNPALNGGAKPLTSYGLFDQFLTAPSTPAYTLNRYNYDAMADLLIPRSVAYSAGLINYFFRGKIDFVPDPNNAGAYLIKNLSSEAMTGAFTLYYDDVNGVRQPVPGATWNLTIAANSQYSFVSFTPPTSPAPKIDGEYMLVFNGNMGEETATQGVTVGAVAVKKIWKDAHTAVGRIREPAGNWGVAWTKGQISKVLKNVLGRNITDLNGVSGDGLTMYGNAQGGIPARGFKYSNSGVITELKPLAVNTVSSAAGMSGDGTVIAGNSYGPYTGQPVRWLNDGTALPLGTAADGERKGAKTISADGKTIVGIESFPQPPGIRSTIYPWYWTQETGYVPMGGAGGSSDNTTLAVSGNGRVIVGQSWIDGEGVFPTAYYDGAGVRLSGGPGGNLGSAEGVSYDGSIIVGWIGPMGGRGYACLWKNGSIQMLGDLPGATNSGARGVSPDGKYIVGEVNIDGYTWAFEWTEKTGMKLLQNLPAGDYSNAYSAN